jgi:folate-dependent phosphoribosylglycinamide formyltransferase PurN
MRLRLHLILSEEPVFHPVMADLLIRELAGEHDVVGITGAVGDTRKVSRAKRLREWRHMFGVPGFLLLSWQSAVYILYDKLGFKKQGVPFSVKRVAARHGIPYRLSHNVNEAQHMEWLAALKPDVIVSSNGHIFKVPILELPAHGCINRHTSSLPAYAGLWPVFWALLNGETEMGQTIHTMTAKIDEGSVLAHETFPVREDETFYGIYARAVRRAPALVAGALKNLVAGTMTPLDVSKKSYFGVPSQEDGARFRKQHRFFRMGELLQRVPKK